MSLQLLEQYQSAGFELVDIQEHYTLVSAATETAQLYTQGVLDTVKLLQRSDPDLSDRVAHNLMSIMSFSVKDTRSLIGWLKKAACTVRVLRVQEDDTWFGLDALELFIDFYRAGPGYRMRVYGTLPALQASGKWLRAAGRLRNMPDKRTPRVGITMADHGHLHTMMLPITPTRIGDLDAYYGEGMAEFHKDYVAYLQGPKRGISLLHGPPGGGKTTYLRHLIGCLKSRVILIPKGLLGDLDTPMFSAYLLGLADEPTVLVIEDAEAILVSREGGALSVLLNLSDGLLGDLAQVSIILTYNCETASIDPAALRAGRRQASRTFGPLTPEVATALSAKHGLGRVFVEPTMLCDVLCTQPLGDGDGDD